MWHVRINALVGREDFKHITHADQQKIIDTAIDKLSRDPYAYGEPLRGAYKGYWRLRIGIYRVIYQIHKQEITVYVIMVGKRRDDQVYDELVLRLRQIRRN